MKKKLKILLSAYACEPNKGSEPEIGWQWVLNLSKYGHDIYVITKTNNKKNIEKNKPKNYKNLKFIYFDLPNWILNIISRKGKQNPLSFIYYFLWQVGIYFAVKPYIKKIKFDYIHHVTFGSFRFPSLLSFYKIPFIYGPISGGESCPMNLRKDFLFVEKIIDLLRDISNIYSKFSPLTNFTYINSYKIFATTEESKNAIPSIYHKKTEVLLAVATNKFKVNEKMYSKKKKNFKICFAGRLLSWKGLHIIIETYALIRRNFKNVSLAIIGKGIIKQALIEKAKLLKIENSINWIGHINQRKLFNYFKNSDLIMLPSLRDSGGFVIFEAIKNGSLVAVLNQGGPGAIINNSCGISIDIKNKDQDQIVKDMAKSIIKLIKNKKNYVKLRKEAIKRVNEITWEKKIKKVYGLR